MSTRAQQLRKNATEAEKKLWAILRARRFFGAKFRRQYPTGKYYVDFVCIEKNLILEIDGSQHWDDKALTPAV